MVVCTGLRDSHYSEMGIKFCRCITMVESNIKRNYVRFEVKRYNDITVAKDSPIVQLQRLTKDVVK